MHTRPHSYSIAGLILVSLTVSSCTRMPKVTKASTYKGIKSGVVTMKNTVVRATPRLFKAKQSRYPTALPMKGYPVKKATNTRKKRSLAQKRSRYPAALPLRRSRPSKTCPVPNHRVVLAHKRVSSRPVASRSAAPVRLNTPPQRPATRAQPPQVQPPRQTQAPRLNPQQANQQLFNLAKNGSAQQITALINQGAQANAANGSGETALHSAASTGNTSAAQALLQRGAQVNAQTVQGWTPLHTAARFGRGHLAALLLNNGAQRNIQNRSGKTPLQLARQTNHANIAAMLQR